MSGDAKSGNPHKSNDLIVVPRRDLAIDFANTLGWRGSTPAESLHGLGDVIAWLSANKAAHPAAMTELQKWFDGHSAQSTLVFNDAIAIRESIYRLLSRDPPSTDTTSEDFRQLNKALGEAAPRTRLERTADAFGWRIAAKPTAAGILAPVLWSAADILVGPDSVRVRACANEQCRWLFLDDSKNGSRRWCSMQACGNRAKAHRHYLRKKEA
jgi:predicted RNA-binding Zn ribbon-like protein